MGWEDGFGGAFSAELPTSGGYALFRPTGLATSSMLIARALVLVSFLPLGTREDPSAGVDGETAGGGATLAAGSFCVDRGEEPDLWVPPGESLDFRVDVDLGVLGDASVGTVNLSSGIEPFVAGLPRPGEQLPESGAMVAWIRIAARGGHLGYELDHSISTRFLPQAWPSLISFEEQKGSENRKREIKLGRGEELWRSAYRANGHCRDCTRLEHFVKASLPWNDDYHCNGCKRGEHRIWNPAKEREVPGQSVDILGAVYLARGLVRQGLEDFDLFMVQKDRLWKVRMKRGGLRDIEVPAGTFRCREVSLEVSQPPGEDAGSGKFSGLFGIKGALKIWLQEPTGVPVMIEGDVPVGDIVDLHARIGLSKYRGTPPAFAERP